MDFLTHQKYKSKHLKKSTIHKSYTLLYLQLYYNSDA